ncbi:hypothetical protein EBT25_07630 [bacterium]|nr:hypothetical protein [bacterium]
MVMGANNGFLGVINITRPFVQTPYTKIVGSLSNTTAAIANVSTGTGATFKIGSLTDTETVYLSPDFLSSNNTGSVKFSTINLNANNSNASGYGFVKFPGANVNSILLDCFRFDATTIGSIASITGRDPGSDYNADPFVLVVDPYVYGYDRHDYVITVTDATGAFTLGEQIQQTYSQPAIQLTVNNFSGTAANGSSTTTVFLNEFVYQSNSSANVAASGYVVEAGITGGSGTIKLRDVTGTFTVSSTYKIKGLTSGSTANSQAVATTALAITARGLVKGISNTTTYRIKRINLENTFQVGSSLLGKGSSVTATLSGIEYESNTRAIGINANIVANVQTANNVATKLDVIDSGFGYIDQEVVTLTKSNSDYTITAVVGLNKQGVGQGFFSSERGFLDSSQRLQDNDYYQGYSYEIVTKIPFAKYVDVLKKINHPVGTKMFGRVDSTTLVESNITVTSAINTTNTA